MKRIIFFIGFLLFFSVSTFAGDLIPCHYYSIDSDDFITDEGCFQSKAINDDTSETDGYINQDVILQARYDADGLGVLWGNSGIYYFNANGKLRRVVNFDNGADYFREGLARSLWNNKVGYINKQLDIVISPVYDFAYPFNDGLALVCSGCVDQRIKEYSSRVGGHWGIINQQGEIVVPISYTRDVAIQKLKRD